MQRRAGSIVVGNYHDLDFMVLHFSCLDSAVRKALGVSQKECEWRVQCRDSPPSEIKLHVDKSVIGKVQVQIVCNGQTIFPKGFSQKARLFEDFFQTWPFRGIARGIGAPHFVEMKLWIAGVEKWLPGTITRQRPDGLFEVLVMKDDPFTGGLKEEFYPAVKKADLREKATRNPFQAPERSLNLLVPASDPLNGVVLSIDGGEQVTQYFGRPTPPRKSSAGTYSAGNTGDEPEVVLRVSKDRSSVVGNVGAAKLLNYLAGDVRACDCISKKPGKLVGYGSKVWVIQVGQAEHTIEIERRWKACKVVTLTVDGETLIEGLGEDLGCSAGHWQVSFRLVGEPVITFEVHETDADGRATETTGRVTQKRSFTRTCEVIIADLADLSAAHLCVDGRDFSTLAPKLEMRAEEDLVITPEAMMEQYGIMVPYKLSQVGPNNPWGGLASTGGSKDAGIGGFFSACMFCKTDDQEVEVADAQISVP